MAFEIPKTTIKENKTACESMPKDCEAKLGKIDLSSPTIPPTKALISTNNPNCFQLFLKPKCVEIPDISIHKGAKMPSKSTYQMLN